LSESNGKDTSLRLATCAPAPLAQGSIRDSVQKVSKTTVPTESNMSTVDVVAGDGVLAIAQSKRTSEETVREVAEISCVGTPVVRRILAQFPPCDLNGAVNAVLDGQNKSRVPRADDRSSGLGVGATAVSSDMATQVVDIEHSSPHMGKAEQVSAAVASVTGAQTRRRSKGQTGHGRAR
jgi:hypothetical protein